MEDLERSVQFDEDPYFSMKNCALSSSSDSSRTSSSSSFNIWSDSSTSHSSSNSFTNVDEDTSSSTSKQIELEADFSVFPKPSTSKENNENYVDQQLSTHKKILTDSEIKDALKRPFSNLKKSTEHTNVELNNLNSNSETNFSSEFSFQNKTLSNSNEEKCEGMSNLPPKSKCSFCSQTFSNRISLDKHKCLKSPVSCDVCGELFDTMEEVKNHKYTHIICETFPCDICDKNEKNSAKKSNAVDRYICVTCGKTFNSFNLFSQHLKVHLTVTPFSCETCGKTFNLLNSYQQHLASHKKLHYCTICGTAFKTKLLCHQHKLKHVKKIMYYCESCGKSFRTQSKLKAHSQVHEVDKTYQCKECGTSYSYKASLLRHNSKYHSINSKKFPCTQCGEVFKNKLLLRYHVALHTASKVITCTECTRSFTCASSLKRHMFKHNGIRPFPCTVCGKTFLTKRDLRSHLSVIHFDDVVTDDGSSFRKFISSHTLSPVNKEEISNTTEMIENESS